MYNVILSHDDEEQTSITQVGNSERGSCTNHRKLSTCCKISVLNSACESGKDNVRILQQKKIMLVVLRGSYKKSIHLKKERTKKRISAISTTEWKNSRGCLLCLITHN